MLLFYYVYFFIIIVVKNNNKKHTHTQNIYHRTVDFLMRLSVRVLNSFLFCDLYS